MAHYDGSKDDIDCVEKDLTSNGTLGSHFPGGSDPDASLAEILKFTASHDGTIVGYEFKSPNTATVSEEYGLTLDGVSAGGALVVPAGPGAQTVAYAGADIDLTAGQEVSMEILVEGAAGDTAECPQLVNIKIEYDRN